MTSAADMARMDAIEAANNARMDQLEAAQSRSPLAAAGGYGQAILGGINEGIARAPGLPVDMYNLVGDAVAGRLPAYLADKLGATGAAAAIRANGYHDIYPGSGQSFVDAEKKIGIGYQPVTPGEQTTKDVIGGATTSGLAALATGGLGGLLGPAGTDGATLMSNAGNQALTGAGGVIGGKTAGAVNDATGGYLPKPLADIIGSIFGAGTAGGIANRTALYEPTQMQRDAAAANVPLYYPKDAGNSGAGAATVNGLANRFGAQDYSKGLATDTQDGITNYIKGQLTDPANPNGLSLQKQGTAYQGAAQKTIDAQKAQTSAAYDDLAKVVPGWSLVSTGNSAKVVADMNNRAGGNSFIQSLVQNPTFSRFADLPNNPIMSWDQMNLVRQEAGAAMNNGNLSGSERGQASQLYGAVMDDLRGGAIGADPTGLEKFEKATNTARDNNEQINGILQNVINAPSPETIPGYLAAQTGKGDTRLQGLMGGLTDAEQGRLGQSLLTNAATAADGGFDPSLLMKFILKASPEAKSALTSAPGLEDAMNRFVRLQQGTADGSGAIVNPASAASHGDAGGWMSALGAGSVVAGDQLLEHALTTPAGLGAAAATGAAAGAVYPGATNVMARGLLGTGLGIRLTSPVDGNMVTGAQKLTGSGIADSQFPDVYQPPAPTPTPDTPSDGGDTMNWLGTADRPSVTAFIASRLGPDVADQLAKTDPIGYRAALVNMASDPTYRQALTETPSTD